MRFSGKELATITKLALIMAGADGKFEPIEMDVIKNEVRRFTSSEKEEHLIMEAAKEIEAVELLTIISQMTLEQKKYVAAYLRILMISDENLDGSELKLWRATIALCGLPALTFKEAAEFLKAM